MKFRPSYLKFWNFWPPFLFSGIRIRKISDDFRYIETSMKLRFWNQNYVGTQYGGSIYSMTDPFYMLMLYINLGEEEYVIWDKAAQIHFLKPGRKELFASFSITDEDLDHIRQTVAEKGKMDWERKVNIFDSDGLHIASVNKVVYIRKKKPSK